MGQLEAECFGLSSLPSPGMEGKLPNMPIRVSKIRATPAISNLRAAHGYIELGMFEEATVEARPKPDNRTFGFQSPGNS
jgi:hypothetical protein